MILVHKPQAIHNYGPVSHRRHPSAPLPALVQTVLPTKTPGLLSLSKPTQNRNRSSPKPKQKSPQPGNAVSVASLEPAAEIVDTQSAKVSQSPEKRGRQAPTANSKAKSTPRSVSSRRPRQQTPTVPSQAEESLSMKPFFEAFSNRSSPTQALKLTKPSGKLAHRRQANSFSEAPTPSKAIPVPTLATNRKSSFHKRASAPPAFAFPICDDISELGDPTDVDDISPPTTPTRPRRQHTYTYGFEDGPKSAPLSSSGSMASFQFNQSASLRGHPASGKKAGSSRPRKHVRSPSEGVFHMSDEEKDNLPSLSSSSGSSSYSSLNSSPSEDLRALFGLGPLGSYGKKQRAMFASSTFLNSPDPEELPPPSF